MATAWPDADGVGDEIWGASDGDAATSGSGEGTGGGAHGNAALSSTAAGAPAESAAASNQKAAATASSVTARMAAAARQRRERLRRALGITAPADAAAATNQQQQQVRQVNRRRRHHRPAPHNRAPRSHVIPGLAAYEDESEGELERQQQAARDRRNAYAAAAIGAAPPATGPRRRLTSTGRQSGDGSAGAVGVVAQPLEQVQATVAAAGRKTAAFVEESLDDWWHFGVGGADASAHPNSSTAGGQPWPSLGELLFGDFPSLPPGPFAAHRSSGSGTAGTLLRLPSGIMRGALAPLDPAWWATTAPRVPRKPLGLKLAELALPKEVLGVAETIQKDILEADQPLGPAVIVFLLRALASVVQDWADANLEKVFGVFAIYTMISCGIVALGKRAVKRAARAFAVPSPALLLRWLRHAANALRLPGRHHLWRQQERGAAAVAAEVVAAVTGQSDGGGVGTCNPRERWVHPLATPVAVITDHLMPTQFFGPYLCAYVTARVLVSTAIARRQLEAAEEEVAAAVGGGTTSPTPTAPAADGNPQQQQQPVGSGQRISSQGAEGADGISEGADGDSVDASDCEPADDFAAAPARFEPLLPSVEVAGRAIRDAAARAATTLTSIQPMSLLTTSGGGSGVSTIPEVEMARRGGSAVVSAAPSPSPTAASAAGGGVVNGSLSSSRKAASAGPSSRAESPVPVTASPQQQGHRRGNSFDNYIGQK